MQLTSTSYINLDFFLRSFFHNYVDAFAYGYLSNTSKNQSSVHKTKKSDAERAIDVAIFIEEKTVIADRFFDQFDNFIAGYIFKITQFILFGRPERSISSPLNALTGEWLERDSRWIFNNQQLCLIDDCQRRNFTFKTIANNRNTLKLDTTNIENKEIRIKRTFYFDSDKQTLQQRSHGTSLTIWKRIK
jgi:hypothetical protein